MVSLYRNKPGLGHQILDRAPLGVAEQMVSETRLQDQIVYERQLRHAVEHVRSSLDIDQIFCSSAISLRQLLHADCAVIYRLSTAEASLPLCIVATDSRTMVPVLGLPQLQHRRFVEMLQYLGTAEYAVISNLDISNLDRCDLHPDWCLPWQQAGFSTALIAPWGGDRPQGLICLHQYGAAQPWQPFELEGLSQVASEMTLAVEQGDRYRHMQSCIEALTVEVREQAAQVRQAALFDSTLKRITDSVRDSLDEAQILQTAVRELALVLELGGCNAALYDLEQETSTIVYEYASASPAYCGRVAQMSDFSEIYDQLRQQVYFQFCSLSPNPERGRVSLLACPIFLDAAADEAQQEVLGDLWLVHHPEHVFNEFEIRLVQQIANQCAIAIRQTRLYRAARAQVDELRQLNRLKDEFLSTVSHELRTPIANVRMALRMLETTSLSDKQRKYIEILESESQREAALIDDLLDMQRLEAGSVPVQPQTIHLQSWITQLVQPFQGRIASRGQTLSLRVFPNTLRITSDVNILQRILAELLNNACKYTAADGHIQLTCTASPNQVDLSNGPSSTDVIPGTIRITVRNQAQIPPSELPHIFERFYRVPHADPWRQAGTGLGLALVQKLVTRLTGSIQADSYDGWTWFTVTLPLNILTESL